MVQLLKFLESEKDSTVKRIADFYGFHNSLLENETILTHKDYKEAESLLKEWLSPPHIFYMIEVRKRIVGFIHICFRGKEVAWIEDIYIDVEMRNQGVATRAIGECETIMKEQRGATALCMDVVTRNKEALQLYHKLGYNNLSMITVRKEFYENKRNIRENILGLDYNI
jgi:ribosomal protein S18 acetylase RimI-like enzyme